MVELEPLEDTKPSVLGHPRPNRAIPRQLSIPLMGTKSVPSRRNFLYEIRAQSLGSLISGTNNFPSQDETGQDSQPSRRPSISNYPDSRDLRSSDNEEANLSSGEEHYQSPGLRPKRKAPCSPHREASISKQRRIVSSAGEKCLRAVAQVRMAFSKANISSLTRHRATKSDIPKLSSRIEVYTPDSEVSTHGSVVPVVDSCTTKYPQPLEPSTIPFSRATQAHLATSQDIPADPDPGFSTTQFVPTALNQVPSMSSSSLSLSAQSSTKDTTLRFHAHHGAQREADVGHNGKSRPSGGKGRFLSKMNKMVGWFSTSEPSLQALKRHKKVTFERAGLTLDDPQASAKLHAPIGEIPEDAIKPAGPGPDPEEVARKKAEKSRARSAETASTASRMSRSSSSGFSESSSVKTKFYSPHFPFD